MYIIKTSCRNFLPPQKTPVRRTEISRLRYWLTLCGGGQKYRTFPFSETFDKNFDAWYTRALFKRPRANPGPHRDAKVREFDAATTIDEYVPWLDVAVDLVQDLV